MAFLVIPLYAQQMVTIAVLGLEPTGISKAESNVLTNRIRSILVNTSRFQVLERANMEAILLEQGFQQSGCTSEECIVEVGQLLGVQKMLTGSVGKFGRVYTIELRIIDVETGKIESASTYDFQGEMENLLTEGAQKSLQRILQSYETKTNFGSLLIYSKPSSAAVKVNEQTKGKTPLALDRLPPGIYNISLSSADFDTYETSITIRAGITEKLTANLIPSFTFFQVNTDVPEAVIQIDSENRGLGSTGLLNLSPGLHHLLVHHQFYLPIVNNFDLTPGDTVIHSFKLKRAQGILSLGGQPAQATYKIADKQGDLSHLKKLELPAGNHQLFVTAPYYYPLEEDIRVARDTTIVLNINLNYGGDDLSRSQSRQKWLLIGSLASAGLSAISGLLANTSYNNYEAARTSEDAEKYKNQTNTYDQMTTVFLAVTATASVLTIWNWLTLHNLKRDLNVQ